MKHGFYIDNDQWVYHQPERASNALANLALVEFTLASCFSTSSCETVVFDIKGWSGFMYTDGSFTSANFPYEYHLNLQSIFIGFIEF